MVSGLWMAGSYAHHQSTRYYYPHSTEGKTGVHGGQTEGHLARRWPSQDLNPHQLTPETVLITIEPLGLTVCLSSQALIFLVHHVSQCQIPAWRKEYIFRESAFCKSVYPLKFIFNSKSVLLVLPWVFAVMHAEWWKTGPPKVHVSNWCQKKVTLCLLISTLRLRRLAFHGLFNAMLFALSSLVLVLLLFQMALSPALRCCPVFLSLARRWCALRKRCMC